MRIDTSTGHRYELSERAVEMLRSVFSMHSVDRAFEDYAMQVPRGDRYEVWDKLN